MKNRVFRVLSLILLFTLTALTFLTGCGLVSGDNSSVSDIDSAEDKYSKTVFAMDIPIELTAYGEQARAAVDEAGEEVQRIDELLSVTHPDSQIGRLNARTGNTISDETLDVIRESIRMNLLTGGSFNITIYPVVRAWGFTTGDEYRIPEDAEIAELLSHVGMEKFSLTDQEDGSAAVSFTDEDTMLDTGAITKGYASDRIYSIFEKYGIESALASLGGNILTMGNKPDGSDWKIGIADPFHPDDYMAAVSVEDKFLVTSGGYERYFEEDGVRYIHIMDPSTGRPVDNDLESVTIISDNGTEADALSTALFVRGLDGAMEFWRTCDDLEFELILIDDDGQIYASEGIADSCSPTGSGDVQIIKR